MNIFKYISRFFKWVLIFFFTSSILSVVILKWMPVYYTPLMLSRNYDRWLMNREPKCEHEWIALEQISPSMPRAVIAGEDAHFLEHSGFDFKEIYKARLDALKAEEKGDTDYRARGASTISQQTAKNVFLWHGRDLLWVRKALEAYFTVLIEKIWGKDRIMEVYLNSIEMGDGIYGIEAAAREKLHTRPSLINDSKAALIAATLPNPLKRDSAKPSAKVRKRQRAIMREMRFVPAHEWRTN